jgi:hypothetical protein
VIFRTKHERSVLSRALLAANINPSLGPNDLVKVLCVDEVTAKQERFENRLQ